MDNGKREFDELRHILQKLDRSLDEAQHKRQHGDAPAAPIAAHAPSHSTQSATQPRVPSVPAVIPSEDDNHASAEPGRLKAKPLRRAKPENQGPAHGWVH